ncbi:unnamed protein product [Lactuca virosa]|uniref:Peroxin-14 n=1 Tax=Lactuca virosa TaxID=75947 RepID=A0AAU9PF05_9ASTR|nr:unnamed protein product [Lactuca virosa]
MFVPSKEPVNGAVFSPSEIEKEINIFKQSNDPTPEQMEALIEQLQSTERKPPQAIPVTTESPSGTQVHQDDQSPIVEPAQVDQDDQSPILDQGFDFFANDEMFASGSSSAPPPPKHDVASVMLAKLLSFQDSIPQSRGKGISIGSGHGGDC